MDQTQASGILTEVVRTVRTLRMAKHRSREQSLIGTKFAFLQHLLRKSVRLSDLAHHHMVSLPVASRAVDALVSDGLACRHPDPDDARAALISITDAGRREITDRQETMIRKFAEGLEKWSDDDVAVAMRLLGEINDCLARVTDLSDVSGTPPSGQTDA